MRKELAMKDKIKTGCIAVVCMAITAVLWIFVLSAFGVTETHLSRRHVANEKPGERAFKKVVITATDTNDFSETISPVYGIVKRIVIKNTGNDDAFDVSLTDENGVSIFSKTSIDGDPNTQYGYAVYQDDTEGNPWEGVAIGGEMVLTVANAANKSMTRLDITIYYISYWN